MHNVVDAGLHILAQARGSYYMKHEQGQECNEKAKIESWNTNEYHFFGFWRPFSLSYARHIPFSPAVKYNLMSLYRLGYLRSMASTHRVFFFPPLIPLHMT
jgi:hypothetical protein